MKPSNVQHPPNHAITMTEVQKGLFVIENAYEGKYDFFEGLTSALRENRRGAATASKLRHDEPVAAEGAPW